MSQSLGVFVSIIPAQLTKECPITTSVYCLSMSRDMPSPILVTIQITVDMYIYIYIAYLVCQFSTRIGQFAHLLPSLDVVAVSQAPSPESNPNSPSPVATMVSPLPYDRQLIGQKFE